MRILNFTNKIIPGTEQHSLNFPTSISVCISYGKSVENVSRDICNQIEMRANPGDAIVLDLPSFYFDVERRLAQYDIVSQVFYASSDLAYPSPVFAFIKQTMAEKQILQEICDEEIEKDLVQIHSK